MTTRAGLVGILTGMFATAILFTIDQPLSRNWFTIILPAILMLGGGYLAGHWGGTVQPWRSFALGGLAGGLAGSLVFCLFGAAISGLTVDRAVQAQASLTIVRQTYTTFLTCFWGGMGLGSLGGWLAHPLSGEKPETFDKSAPQMALNASITAVAASVFAAVISAAVFSPLAGSVRHPIMNWTLAIALMLVLVSHLTLTLVIPHEAHQAEHRCGMDEVRMAAYVGIGAAPVLALLLFLVKRQLFLSPFVIVSLLISSGLSLKSLHTLSRLILPRRAAFPAPGTYERKVQATFFGTIADSQGARLIVLCIGCGLVMVLPLQVTIFSVLINLLCPPSDLFLTQALWSSGLILAASTLLTSAYLFYLNLGRWFRKRLSQQIF